MIDSAFEKVAENKTEDLNVHFVCAGFYNWLYSDEPEFRSLLPERMAKICIIQIEACDGDIY